MSRSDWTKTYRTPLWLAGAYVALLALVALAPTGRRASSIVDLRSTAAPTPRTAECVVCGIAQTCDPATGQCMFVHATPLPCVQGTKFDTKAGFCLPDAAATVQPVVSQTPGFFDSSPPPDGFGNLPGFGGNQNNGSIGR